MRCRTEAGAAVPGMVAYQDMTPGRTGLHRPPGLSSSIIPVNKAKRVYRPAYLQQQPGITGTTRSLLLLQALDFLLQFLGLALEGFHFLPCIDGLDGGGLEGVDFADGI